MGRSTKPAFRRFASGWADTAAPILILGVPALLGLSGFMNQQQGSATAAWTEVGVRALAFFAVSTPLVMLGIYILSRIFRFQLSGGTYIRAAAIAAVPMVALMGASLLSTGPGLKAVAMLVAVPVAALLAGAYFELKPLEMLAAAGICIPLLLVGIGLSNKASTMAVRSSDDIAAMAQRAGVPVGTSSAPTTATPRGPARTAGPDPLQVRLDDLAARVEQTTADAPYRMTREQFDERIKIFQADLESLRTARGTTPQWQQLSTRLRDLETQGRSLPSETPDDSLFQPMATSQNWSSIALDAQGGEISFDRFNLRLPGTAKLDLRTSDPAAPVLSWIWPNSWTTMSLKLSPAPDARQRRPWIVSRAVFDRLMPAPRFFVIEADASAMTAGNLADTLFFRIDRSATSHTDVLYTALLDGNWLTATITGPAASDGRAAFEAAIKSLRKRPETEAGTDVFAPALLVRRLEDDPDTAAALLRKQGAASEDALLAAATNGDPRLQARALAVLSDVATARSVETLKPLLDSSDKAVSQGAMTVLRRVAPLEYDDIAMAAMSLKRGSGVDKRAALQKLAATPKDPNRPQITRELDAFILLENAEYYDDTIKALAVWADSQTATLLLPWLAEGASARRRNAAFAILPTTKDPLVVLPMLRWTVREPERVVKAIVAIGPPAEDEVIRQLFTNLDNNRNPEVRKAGARMLQEIGSAKSIPVLQRASNDPRDAGAAQVAKAALEIVRQRVPARGGPTAVPQGRG